MNTFLRITSLLLATVCVCSAQSGFVKSSGQPIPGATVVITQQAQTFSTVTDSDGHYTFPPLTPGAWSVKVDMFGFVTLTQNVDFAAIGEKPSNFELELKQSPILQRMQERQQQGAAAPTNSPTAGTPPSRQGAGNAQNRQRAGANANAAGQQLDQQIQNELNAQQNLDQGGSNPNGGSNESFLVTGSLSPGVAQGAQADSGPDMRFGGPGAQTDAAGNPVGSPFGQGGALGGAHIEVPKT